MKKKILHYLLPLALCCAANVLQSCDKDDSSEITPTQKPVTRITMTYKGETSPYTTYNFRYNAKGRFAEITFFSKEFDDTLRGHFFQQDDRLILTSENSPRQEVFLLNDEGYIVMADPWEELYTKFRLNPLIFDYADGHLKSMIMDGFPFLSCTWAHGDMVAFTNTLAEDDVLNIYYHYAATENKMNIDPAHLFCDLSNTGMIASPSSLMFSWGYYGGISKHLPAELMIFDGVGKQALSFTYTFDTDGYPVGISVLRKWNDPDDNSEMQEETMIGISYAE